MLDNLPIHPVLQLTAVIFMLYAWYTGLQRFRMKHLKQKVKFNWKGHVRYGLAGSIVMLAGAGIGLYMVQVRWYMLFVTGIHGIIGVLMIPLPVFALVSGLCMDRKKKNRKVLPLVHAAANTLMIILALIQVYTGIRLYIDHVLYIQFGIML